MSFVSLLVDFLQASALSTLRLFDETQDMIGVVNHNFPPCLMDAVCPCRLSASTALVSYSAIDVYQGWDGCGERFLISGKIPVGYLTKPAV